ncbi:WD40 repeat domain-containing protein [Bremerella sp.]|uniref:WD40 repeat domain-containing protein n=1 Tax=Bremerella sp. TaxID=2795602 RepID=UPI00391DD50D
MQINKPVHQWQLSFEGEWPTSVAFLEDSQRIAAGNRAGQIYIWELPETPPEKEVEDKDNKDNKEDSPPDFAPVLRLDGHTNAISHLRVTPDGKTLISSSWDHTIRLWDWSATPKREVEVVLDAHTREKKTKYKSAEQKEAILSAPGVKVSTSDACHVLSGHTSWIQALGISDDGKRLVSGDDNCLSIVWDLGQRKQISAWHGYDRVWVRSAALSADGKTAFTAEYADRRSDFDAPAAQARLWNADDGSLTLDLLKVWTPKVKDEDRIDSYNYRQAWTKLVKRGLVCAEFSPDGKLLAVGQGGETDTGQIHLVDTSTGEIARTVSGHRYGTCDVRFSADGKYVLSSGRDTMVRICQVADGKEVATLGKERGGQFKDWIHAIAISPDQKKVAAADIAGMIHIWQLES